MWLTITSQGVRARVNPVGLESGRLAVPDDPRTVGWWAQSAAPGASHGTAVVAGHVDTARAGRGALFGLSTLAMGSEVRITAGRRVVRYRVMARRIYEKQELPQDVFATTGLPRLVLITCVGPFDKRTRHYRDNIVVYAIPSH